MKKEEKEYVEAEVLGKENDSSHKINNNMSNQMKDIKKAILLKGISALILPILIFTLIVGFISWLIMYVIDTHPFDYIITGLFLFFILSPVYKLIKMFR